MKTYFDAVLDGSMRPVFNGTPFETKTWLEKNQTGDLDLMRVCPGHTMRLISVAEYLSPT